MPAFDLQNFLVAASRQAIQTAGRAWGDDIVMLRKDVQNRTFDLLQVDGLAASFEAYLKTKQELNRRFRNTLDMSTNAPQMWENFFNVPGAATNSKDDEPDRDHS
jgi:hypothetical protein